MFQEKVQEWIDKVVSQSSTRLDVREHNLVESFAIWLDQQAAEHGVERTLSKSSEAIPGVVDEIEELWAGE